ncbi:uncharacterized protein N0V89_007611 [Didymosphaeria variabile]|uniref:Uncharacterized protein n=1 Tax=Didymosphaeria variabile TaxID=1932322 RepID=A0A9W8XJF7_9PLEO|nr:uncharacterized protein N0V89_007611 [Didymosphaeria variabile]KAJ4352264.1 hypothetical protein N0V89_007611 [Didymosphaeria variabile]
MQEKEVLQEVEMQRLGLILYGTGVLADRESHLVRQWLAQCPLGPCGGRGSSECVPQKLDRRLDADEMEKRSLREADVHALRLLLMSPAALMPDEREAVLVWLDACPLQARRAELSPQRYISRSTPPAPTIQRLAPFPACLFPLDPHPVMSPVAAVLLPLMEDTRKCVELKVNRKHRCTVSSLEEPMKGLIAERYPLERAVVIFDPTRLTGEHGLSFGSGRDNDIVLVGSGITSHQFLIAMDPVTRSLTVKNISSDKLDTTTNTTTTATDIFVHDLQRLRTVAPGETKSLEGFMQVAAGEDKRHRFQIFLPPGPADALLERRIDDYLRALPDA